jgi:hypothetical protein
MVTRCAVPRDVKVVVAVTASSGATDRAENEGSGPAEVGDDDVGHGRYGESREEHAPKHQEPDRRKLARKFRQEVVQAAPKRMGGRKKTKTIPGSARRQHPGIRPSTVTTASRMRTSSTPCPVGSS